MLSKSIQSPAHSHYHGASVVAFVARSIYFQILVKWVHEKCFTLILLITNETGPFRQWNLWNLHYFILLKFKPQNSVARRLGKCEAQPIIFCYRSTRTYKKVSGRKQFADEAKLSALHESNQMLIILPSNINFIIILTIFIQTSSAFIIKHRILCICQEVIIGRHILPFRWVCLSLCNK